MKTSLQDRLGQISKSKEQAPPAMPKVVIQEAVVKRRTGRPTFKSEGVAYARIFADIPETLKDKMSLALVKHFKGRYSTMSELINAALDEYLAKYE